MKNWLAFLILLFVFLVVYHSAPSIFFRQDEWLGFGSMIADGPRSIISSLNSGSHFVPIPLSIDYLLFKYVGLNYYIYNLVGLAFHFINAVLIFIITKLLLDRQGKEKWNNSLSLLTGIFFISSSVAVQLILWTVISINTLSLTFSLIIFWLTVKFWQYPPLKFGFGVSILTLLALFTLEYSLGIIFFILVAILIYKENIKRGELKKILFPFLSLVGLYFLMRVTFLLQATEFPTGGPSNPLNLLTKIIETPLRYIGQIVFSERLNLSLSNLMVDIPDSLLGEKIIPENLRIYLSSVVADHLNIAENLLFKVLAIIVGLIFFYLLYRLITYTRYRQKDNLKDLLVVLLFLVVSAFPFIIIPGQSSDFQIFPSRYLYFGLAGYSVLLGVVLKILFNTRKRLLFGAVFFFILVNIVYGTLDNWQRINAFYEEGQTRLGILSTIKSSYPKLPQKVVFFSESDSSFYGLPEKERVLPFQSGFGQTLLVWYQLSENFPKEFFQNKFLWEIKGQGYAEFDGRGFGYFRDFSSLARLLQDKKLPPESVIAFRYDSGQGSIQDITKEVQGRLEGYRVGNSAVDRAGLIVSASNNSQDAWMAIDGDRKSAWDSELPYNRPQYFEIDLSKAATIAQITIDTYNNVNQNQVGFAVSLSSDGKTWKDVFYAKRYPPDESGYINIYFKPQLARFIKISQIGSHAYANWVIHDLKIYEKNN